MLEFNSEVIFLLRVALTRLVQNNLSCSKRFRFGTLRGAATALAKRKYCLNKRNCFPLRQSHALRASNSRSEFEWLHPGVTRAGFGWRSKFGSLRFKTTFPLWSCFNFKSYFLILPQCSFPTVTCLFMLGAPPPNPRQRSALLWNPPYAPTQ